MNEKCSALKAAKLIKTTLIDFPNHIAAAVFFPGCNLRCPYCYNAALANGKVESDFASFDEIYSHLEKRKNVLQYLVISGGEALLHEACAPMILFAKKLGYKIKLDTNGTLPEKLSVLIKNKNTKPDYIAMDIKTSLHRYGKLQKKDAKNVPFPPHDFSDEIKQSIKIIAQYPSEAREWRTVLVPTLIEESDIAEITSLLPKDAHYFLSPFQNNGCLDESFDNISPYSETEMQKLLSFAKDRIAYTKLR